MLITLIINEYSPKPLLTQLRARLKCTVHLVPTFTYSQVTLTPHSEQSSSLWKDFSKHSVGSLTTKGRKIRLINMLTKHEDILEVASEESINEILDRYLEINTHAASYTWKRLGRELDMNKNLSQNDIPDETEELLELGIDLDDYIPAIHLYFDDDLTIA